MTTRVYDIDGAERDLQWLRDAWDGCEVLPAKIPAGTTEYWQLAAVYCTTGPAVFKVEARRNNMPAYDQPVVLTWPDLGSPSSELPSLPANTHNWSTRGVIQRTSGSGITGFGLGSSYGPWYHSWVLSNAPSDCLSRTGMKGGTRTTAPQPDFRADSDSTRLSIIARGALGRGSQALGDPTQSKSQLANDHHGDR